MILTILQKNHLKFEDFEDNKTILIYKN